MAYCCRRPWQKGLRHAQEATLSCKNGPIGLRDECCISNLVSDLHVDLYVLYKILHDIILIFCDGQVKSSVAPAVGCLWIGILLFQEILYNTRTTILNGHAQSGKFICRGGRSDIGFLSLDQILDNINVAVANNCQVERGLVGCLNLGVGVRSMLFCKVLDDLHVPVVSSTVKGCPTIVARLLSLDYLQISA